MTDKGEKGGKWKKLLGKLVAVAPTAAKVLDTAGDFVPGPAGIALEALARLVAGAGPDDDLDQVAETIMADPALMVRMEELSMQRESNLLDNETRRIEAVNATMRAEAGAVDPWTRRWRPYWGFVAGTCWGLLALALVITILIAAFGGDAALESIPVIAEAFEAMFVFWGVAGAVLGITAWTRGQEKIETAKGRVKSRLLDVTVE